MGRVALVSSIYDVEWVHVFEQDTDAGAVFLRGDGDVPLSRRPRARLVLRHDGSAVIRQSGADDRFVDHPATWSKDGNDIVVRQHDGASTLRIVEHSGDRLLVRMR